MSEVAIKVENLGKKFLIGHRVEGDLRGSFANKFRQLVGNSNGQSKEEFWALKDVSFEIKMGEAVGIIGRNGAGKSTLLKILSRITDPTTGRFEINGRVSSLLEVGTGFHSELSGRENIYLNGTILGMRRAEIKKKFDAIVDFSGVEKFIDTPVKNYSSGMKVRLAFSVAAHLEPEILIIDEVLAVGDAEFQKKCLGKMDEVSKNEGRTVLFVSHSMGAVKSLCSHAILLGNGRLLERGQTGIIVDKYLSYSQNNIGSWILERPKGNVPGFVNSITLNSNGRTISSVPPFHGFAIHIKFTIVEEIRHLIIGLGMTTIEDYPVRTVWSKPMDISPGTYEAIFEEKAVFFATGKYKLIVGLSSREQTFQYLPEAATIEVDDFLSKDKVIKNTLGVMLNPMDIKIQKNESIIIS